VNLNIEKYFKKKMSYNENYSPASPTPESQANWPFLSTPQGWELKRKLDSSTEEMIKKSKSSTETILVLDSEEEEEEEKAK
jgi:hypothetical protein